MWPPAKVSLLSLVSGNSVHVANKDMKFYLQTGVLASHGIDDTNEVCWTSSAAPGTPRDWNLWHTSHSTAVRRVTGLTWGQKQKKNIILHNNHILMLIVTFPTMNDEQNIINKALRLNTATPLKRTLAFVIIPLSIPDLNDWWTALNYFPVFKF